MLPTRSAFYGRFTAQLARLLEQLLHEVLARKAKSSPRLMGTFARFREVLAIDSTILRLHNALEVEFPSIWTNYMRASAKLNVGFQRRWARHQAHPASERAHARPAAARVRAMDARQAAHL